MKTNTENKMKTVTLQNTNAFGFLARTVEADKVDALCAKALSDGWKTIHVQDYQIPVVTSDMVTSNGRYSCD